MKIVKIVSGGQTGADRAAFDFALANGIEIGGFVPKGRLAEDCPIPVRYVNLKETATANYSERTELNVVNSDATLIFSDKHISGGSLLTRRFAELYGKPFMVVDPDENHHSSVEVIRNWLERENCRILNIAGARESEYRGIYALTTGFLVLLFKDAF